MKNSETNTDNQNHSIGKQEPNHEKKRRRTNDLENTSASEPEKNPDTTGIDRDADHTAPSE